MEGDKFVQIFGFFAILVSICHAEVTLTAEKTEVNPGEIVNLVCYITNFEVGNIVSFEKLYEIEGKEMNEQVSANTQLSDLYSQIPRYSITFESKGDKAYNLILNITGITPEDTGTFRCLYNDEEGRVNIEVLTPPDEIELYLNNEKVDDGHSVEMEAGQTYPVKCIVNGGNPAAVVTMGLTKTKDGPVLADITDEFESTSSLVFVALKDSKIKSLRMPSGTTEVKAEPLEITGNFGNKFIRCTGASKSDGTPLTKSLFARFKGTPPEFDCNKSKVSYKGEEKFNITCTVNADPDLTEHFIIFQEGHASQNATIKLNNQDNENGHYRYIFEQEPYSKKWYMILQFDRMYPQMFRTYTFEAANDFGHVKHKVEVTRVASADLKLIMTSTKEYANIGDDVTFECRVLNPQGASLKYTLQWHKLIGKEQQGDIATNWYINEEYKITDRYHGGHVYRNANYTDVTFIINITNVQKNDTGKIGCNINIDGSSISEYSDLNVLAPVEKIYLTSVNKADVSTVYKDGEEEKFSGDDVGMSCFVEGAYPQPDVKIYVGDKDITALFEQTALFKKEGKKPLEAITYDVSLSNNNFAMRYDYNGKDLKCVASVPHSTFPEVATQIGVKLTNYRPMFYCEHEVYAELHTPKVNITCRLIADPPITNMSFTWTKDAGAQNITIVKNGEDGKYKATSSNGEKELEKVMVLEMERVFPQMYRTYYFTASNSLGETTHMVTLKQDGSNEVGKASSKPLNVVLIFFIISIAMLLQ